MKPQLAKSIYKDCKDRGYVEHEGVLYPPAQAAALNLNKPKKKKRAKYFRTGGTDDELNLKHKNEIKDQFTMLMYNIGFPCWPEFLFMKDRKYAMDYAWPEYKLCLEVEGGIFMKGNSGHSSGTGIQRDMDKISQSAALGWRTIRVTPNDLFTEKTIKLIKKCIINGTTI